jgi:hypothetical protein
MEEVTTFIVNLEYVGGMIDKNLLSHAANRLRRSIILSREQSEELTKIIAYLGANLRAADWVSESVDATIAWRLRWRWAASRGCTPLYEESIRAVSYTGCHQTMARSQGLRFAVWEPRPQPSAACCPNLSRGGTDCRNTGRMSVDEPVARNVSPA